MEFRRVLFRSGIVPQGPGIVNVSLAYAVQGKPLDHSDEAYLLICRIIAQALEEHGVDAHTQAVDRSEEHTSELQSLMRISYAVFCLKKKKYQRHTIQYIKNT